MIKMQAIGNLGADAIAGESNGKSVINFSVGVTEKFGNNRSDTYWLKCALWEKPALAPFLKKGMKVYISGRPTIHTFEDRNGLTIAEQKVNVFEIELLTPKEKE